MNDSEALTIEQDPEVSTPPPASTPARTSRTRSAKSLPVADTTARLLADLLGTTARSAADSPSTQDPDGLSAVGSKAAQYLNTTALVANYTATIMLTRNDGKPFSLIGIDLSPYNDSHPGSVYSFVGQKSDGSTVSQDVSLRNQGRGFVPYTLPASFDDLLSVTWTMNMADTALYFDNIRYSFCPGS